MEKNSKMKLVSIPNSKLTIVPLKKKEKKILHESIMGKVDFFRLLICAPSGSGKSTIIRTILKNVLFCTDSIKPCLIIVSSTINEDPIMIDIIKKYKKHISVFAFDRYDTNIHKEILKIIGSETENDNPSSDDEDKKEDNKVFSKFIIIFDDVQAEAMTQTKPMYTLIKTGRHKHCSFIVSCQHFFECPKNIRNNMSHYILFENCGDDLLNDFYKAYINNSRLITFDKFKDIYDEATAPDIQGKKSYNFLFFNRMCNSFRKNLNQEFVIKNY